MKNSAGNNLDLDLPEAPDFRPSPPKMTLSQFVLFCDQFAPWKPNEARRRMQTEDRCLASFEL
jgi:hypothetical protein